MKEKWKRISKNKKCNLHVMGISKGKERERNSRNISRQ
jgi:hypothetical protein